MSNNVKKITDISQGSPEWHELRTGKYVTSTLSFKIRNEFTESAIAQFKNRSGPIAKKYSEMGHLGESLVRKHLLSIGHDLSPEQPIFINEELGILSSVDGISNCGTTLYEIKTVEKETSQTYEKACKGLVRDSHMWQIQHSMLCNPEFKKCTYVVCRLTEGVTGELDTSSLKFVHVYPNKAVQEKIKERAKEFLEAMKNGTLEVPCNALPGDHFELVQEYKRLKLTKDTIEKLLEAVAKKLKDIGVHNANGIKVIKISGRKIIDWEVALTEIADKLTPETKKLINESCHKHTRYTDDYLRIDLRKPVGCVNKLK